MSDKIDFFPDLFKWTKLKTFVNSTEGFIYCIRNDRENLYYIGQTTNLYDRLRSHIKSNTNKFLAKDIRKLSDFSVTILEVAKKEKLDELESKWIQIFTRSSLKLYNKMTNDYILNEVQKQLLKEWEKELFSEKTRIYFNDNLSRDDQQLEIKNLEERLIQKYKEKYSATMEVEA